MPIKLKLIPILYCSFLFGQEQDNKEMIKIVSDKLNLSKIEELKLKTLPLETEKIYYYLIKDSLSLKKVEFAKEIVNLVLSNNYTSISKFDKNNYPGKSLGFPFGWWLDEKFISNELKKTD